MEQAKQEAATCRYGIRHWTVGDHPEVELWEDGARLVQRGTPSEIVAQNYKALYEMDRRSLHILIDVWRLEVGMAASEKYCIGYALRDDDETPMVSLMRVEDDDSQTQIWYGLPSELVELYPNEVEKFTEPSRQALVEMLEKERKLRQG
ncbi:MAG: hypothetical protein OWQ56_05455 [Acidithiobacillus caldus]|nr:hypothetical protein [Acidithiobacillus caldus]